MIEKQGAHNEPSHSRHAVRKRASLAPDVYPRGQSQCSHLHSCPRFAQSCRRLERPADLRRLGHQPQYLHSCARDVPGRRTGGRAARQAAAAPQPTGHDHWTVRLLAGKAVELGFVESISPETIRQFLKKTNSSPGNTSNGVSQP